MEMMDNGKKGNEMENMNLSEVIERSEQIRILISMKPWINFYPKRRTN